MKKIKYQIRNFFGFSKKETNGFIVLVILISLLLIIPYAVEILYHPSNSENANHDQVRLDSLVSILDANSGKTSSKKLQANASNLLLEYFNPNDAGEEQMREILGAKIARTIVRFRDNGGKFFVKKDLSKIYGIDVEIYERVEKFILLPNQLDKKQTAYPSKAPIVKTISSFDINEADTVTLQKIKGIGKVLSARIIKYRDKLGGFITMNQLSEVYGLEPDVVMELNKYAYAEKNFIPIKISINNATYSTLASHPYIGKKNANIIINYRKQHTAYSSLDALKLIPAINSEELDKMMPYLSL